jgi:hypothetical protein
LNWKLPPLALEIGLALAAIALLLCLTRGCGHVEPAPVPRPVLGPQPSTPAPSPTPAPVTAAKATQEAHVIIRRPLPPQGPSSPSGDAPAGPAASPGFEEIEIVLKQDAAASAPVVVITPPPLPVAVVSAVPELDHTRLGVFVGTLPGAFAFDMQTLRGRPLMAVERFGVLPHDVTRVEASVDLLANHKAAGAMGALGGKIYFGAGGYVGYDLATGYFVGAGMRF